MYHVLTSSLGKRANLPRVCGSHPGGSGIFWPGVCPTPNSWLCLPIPGPSDFVFLSSLLGILRWALTRLTCCDAQFLHHLSRSYALTPVLPAPNIYTRFLAFAPGKPVPPPSHRPLCRSRVLAPWPWAAVAVTHPDPLPGDAAVMDAVSPDMSRAISSETVAVTTAQQTPSFKDYWLKQWDVWSSPSLLTEVKSARSIEFRQLPPKPAHFLHLQSVWKP